MTTNNATNNFINPALKADEVAGTSTLLATNPAVQQFHQSAAKAWVNLTGATGVINASYGVATVTRNGVGSYTIAWATAFTTANYCVQATAYLTNVVAIAVINAAPTTGGIIIQVWNETGTAIDPTQLMVTAFGTQ